MILAVVASGQEQGEAVLRLCRLSTHQEPVVASPPLAWFS